MTFSFLVRSLDEGKERFDKVQQEVHVIKEIKAKLDNQEEQIRGAEELLATHHRKIAHLEGRILTETRQAELTEKEKNELFKHLNIIKDMVSRVPGIAQVNYRIKKQLTQLPRLKRLSRIVQYMLLFFHLFFATSRPCVLGSRL